MSENMNRLAEEFWRLAKHHIEDLPDVERPDQIVPPKHFSIIAWVRVLDKIQELFGVMITEPEIQWVIRGYLSFCHRQRHGFNKLGTDWGIDAVVARKISKRMEEMEIRRHKTFVEFVHPGSGKVYEATFSLFPAYTMPVEPDDVRKELVASMIRLALSNHKEYPTRQKQESFIRRVLEDANIVVLNLKIYLHPWKN